MCECVLTYERMHNAKPKRFCCWKSACQFPVDVITICHSSDVSNWTIKQLLPYSVSQAWCQIGVTNFSSVLFFFSGKEMPSRNMHGFNLLHRFWTGSAPNMLLCTAALSGENWHTQLNTNMLWYNSSKFLSIRPRWKCGNICSRGLFR